MTIDIDSLITWRRDLHAHPEFGFEEKRTAAFVVQKLREFGVEVDGAVVALDGGLPF